MTGAVASQRWQTAAVAVVSFMVAPFGRVRVGLSSPRSTPKGQAEGGVGARLRVGRGSHVLPERLAQRAGVRGACPPAQPVPRWRRPWGLEGRALGSCQSGFRRRGEDRGFAQIPGAAGVSETQSTGPLAGRARAGGVAATQYNCLIGLFSVRGSCMAATRYVGKMAYQ